MTPTQLIQQLRADPATIEFETVMDCIAAHYDYRPTGFRNGEVINSPGVNEGSCKVLAFGQLHGLSEAETLACFGRHTREVLANPAGSGHANIRNFLRHGWAGVEFEGEPLRPVAAQG